MARHKILEIDIINWLIYQSTGDKTVSNHSYVKLFVDSALPCTLTHAEIAPTGFCQIKFNQTINSSIIIPQIEIFKISSTHAVHDNIMTHFPHHWPFGQGTHQSLMDSWDKGHVIQSFDGFIGDSLNSSPIVPHICVRESGHHCLLPIHIFVIVNETCRNKTQWNLYQNSYFSIQEIAFENVLCQNGGHFVQGELST